VDLCTCVLLFASMELICLELPERHSSTNWPASRRGDLGFRPLFVFREFPPIIGEDQFES